MNADRPTGDDHTLTDTERRLGRSPIPGMTLLFSEETVETILAGRAGKDAAAVAAVPCPTCVREGGPYRCCACCPEDPGAHEDGQRDHHDLPCRTHVLAALDVALHDTKG